MLCTEFSMLLQAGVTANDGAMMMLDDETDKDSKLVLQELLATLEKGGPLSLALHESAYFPPYMVSMVKVGEKTGRLPDTLDSLAAHYDRQDRLAESIKNAALYPAILLAMMVAVVLVLIVQVLPIFNDVFGRLGSQMSPLAARLMQFGGWLKGISATIALVFGLLFLITFLAWVIPEVREGIVRAFRNRMGKRGIFGKIASAHFVSGITLAMASGLDLDEVIDMAVLISGDSKAVKEQQEKCVRLLRSGSSLADAMRDSGIISVRDSRVLTMGFRSGMADSVMSEVADRSERNVQADINRIVSRIEPTLVVITSVIIGVILLSVMLPLMSIMTTIG
jgi:type IV pilus assembly protein PilC